MRDLTRFVGIPYVDKGTDPAVGLDCWQLVRYFYAQELGITIPDYMVFYRSANDHESASAAIERAIFVGEWQRVTRALFGDVLVFRIADAPWHTAVALDNGMMLHTDKGHSSVIEPVQSLRWRDRLHGAYRWKS